MRNETESIDSTEAKSKVLSQDQGTMPWGSLERLAKVASIVAIPLVLAVIGWIIQNQLSERNLNRDYVQLAVSILKEPDASKTNPALRDWAVDLLNDNSPTKFGPDVVRQLKSGEVTLPAFGAALRSAALMGGVIAITPDGKQALAGNEEGTIKLWDVSSGKEIRTLKGHVGAVTSVAISPDGKMAASGGLDKTVKLWDLGTGMEIRTFVGHTAAVTGVTFSPDGKFLLSGSLDKSIKQWDVQTGRQIGDVLLTPSDF
jgi:WD40 repeat protein